MEKILILGAASAIAEAAARIFASRKDALFLVARNPQKLNIVAADLLGRGASKVGTAAADLCETEGHVELLKKAWDYFGGIDVVLVAYGVLGDPGIAEKDSETARKIIDTNFTSTVSLVTHLADRFEEKGRGTIAVISSVAGDRGRARNYVYGSSKAGLNVFLDGLRMRLAGRGVTVITIKPGYVDTPMTAHLDKNFLYASPESVARGIVRAIDRDKSGVVYLPWFWRWIMGIVRLLPAWVMQRIKI